MVFDVWSCQRNGLAWIFRAFKQKRFLVKKVIFVIEDRWPNLSHLKKRTLNCLFFNRIIVKFETLTLLASMMCYIALVKRSHFGA